MALFFPPRVPGPLTGPYRGHRNGEPLISWAPATPGWLAPAGFGSLAPRPSAVFLDSRWGFWLSFNRISCGLLASGFHLLRFCLDLV